MATVSVVAFRNGSPHSKVHVLQESINNLANTNNANKGDKREIIILRKKPKLLPASLKLPPQTISVSSLISSQNNIIVQSQLSNNKPKKMTKSKENPPKVQNPPPIAVARRNARERNRVKQVNNGFATLRQHIPNEIAEIFENANNNRSANKKLSKVETLRMAVEYIRSLECLLDESRGARENSANLSMNSFPSPASSESLQNSSSFEQSYFLRSPMPDDDEDSNPATPLPPVANHHYSRIPGTNTFQLIPGPATIHSYEDEENIHPLTPNSDLITHEDLLIHQNLMDSNMDFIQSAGQEFTVIPPDMISSEFYSDNSLSPNEESDYIDIKYQPVLNISSDQQDIYSDSLVINSLPLPMPSDNTVTRNLGVVSLNSSMKNNMVLSLDGVLHENVIYSNQMNLKQEPDEVDGRFQVNTNGNENENMEDVISWWQVEQKTLHQS